MTVAGPRVTNRSSRWAATAVALLTFHVAACTQDFKNPSNSSPREASPSVAMTAPSEDEGANRDRVSERKAKSAVIFIGDGMGLSTVTAARIYAGQKRGVDGESHALSWEDFPHVALVKTYNHDAQVPDSAGTATALFSGYRARIGQINVWPNSYDSESWFRAMEFPPGTPLPTQRYSVVCSGPPPSNMVKPAVATGRKLGIVTTARVTHATPAAIYGQAFDRSWEAPDDVPEEARDAGCLSLSEQLATEPIDLVMGGGAAEFEGVDTSRYNPINDLDDITLPAMRLYTPSHMSFEVQRVAESRDEPSLAEMTEAAMTALDGEGGYILMVEAGRIDHAHHGTAARVALEDTVALDEAVAVAKRLAGEDTLILVTADHGHVFTMSGYPHRGNPIHGLVHGLDPDTRTPSQSPTLAEDGRPYTTLSYANGPVGREAADFDAVGDMGFLYPAGVPLGSETHSGEDVPLYAMGAGAEAFGGVMDQPEVGRTLYRVLGMPMGD